MLSILILILWNQFAPKKVKWIPGALIAVAAATALSSILSLPIRYVQISDNFLSGISFMNLSELPKLLTGDLLLLGVTVAFVASAETMLSAAAVDLSGSSWLYGWANYCCASDGSLRHSSRKR